MKEYILIVDIGSTTTKGLLLQKSGNEYKKLALLHSPTTVEKPREDVLIGIKNTVDGLEKLSGCTLWSNKGDAKLEDNVSFYCTSSAGGGLQILVIGLTTFDSAASGKRCAYGAGAVILDTFAINDKRSAVQQMKEIALLHPDLILMTGGTDGGAVAPVVRLAELLQFANPQGKFSSDPIPLIFAGNVNAQPLIKGTLERRFQLHLVANVRPDMQTENHAPARDLIHDIFMNNVMEKAPGYSKVKERVQHSIIPTPLGVLHSIELLQKQKKGDVMMVDIGGATTDVFSNMRGSFYRTVSANYGMSYSISNVFKDIGWNYLKEELPADTDTDYVQNYIADKMLFPTVTPSSSLHFLIEHIMAKAAIYLAREQHLEMNFNTDKIGFLDKMVFHKNIERVVDKFYFREEDKKERFFIHDYEYAIGAGGVISHTQNEFQALIMIADGLNMQGLTLIYRDRDFTSPHYGKLSEIDKENASRLLLDDALQELGWHIRPQTAKWKPNQKVLHISSDEVNMDIISGKKYLIENQSGTEQQYVIQMEKNFCLNDEKEEIELKTSLPVYIDTTSAEAGSDNTFYKSLYELDETLPTLESVFPAAADPFKPQEGNFTRSVRLPYTGEILVSESEDVYPQKIIAENRSDPPKLYIITLFDKYNLGLNKDNIAESILIKEGDVIKMGQKIVNRKKLSLKEQMGGVARTYDSPLRGVVETINLESGTIILREVQDYSTKPVKVKISSRLGVKPEKMRGYLKVEEGDFVYAGDLLAAIRLDRANKFKISMLDKMRADFMPDDINMETDTLKHNYVIAPATGTVSGIDKKNGTLIITYDKKPLQHFAGVYGQVVSIQDNMEIEIAYQGWKLQGIIGFGSQSMGTLIYCEKAEIPAQLPDNPILVIPVSIDYQLLENAQSANVKGIIAPSINYSDLKKFIKQDIGVALTGNENIPFPLLITQGFGSFDLPQESRDFFKEHNDQSVFIDGHTQIRAGVTRPEIIVQKK